MPPPATPRNGLIAVFTGIYVLVEAASVALALTVWNAHRRGNLTGDESATFALLGVSAAAGALIVSLAVVALIRSHRATGLAAVVVWLAWLRTGALAAAVAVIAIWWGTALIVGQLQTAGLICAIVDVILGLRIANVTRRRTRPQRHL